VLLVRKALANHLINGSGLDQKVAALDDVSQTCLKVVHKFESDFLSFRHYLDSVKCIADEYQTVWQEQIYRIL